MLGIDHFHKRYELTSIKAEKAFELGLAHPGSEDGKISTALLTIASPSPSLSLAKATWGNRG